LAKTLTDIPFDQLFTIGFITIAYWMANLRPTFEHYIICLAIVISLNIASSGFGLCVSAGVTDHRDAMTVATVVLLAMLLDAGFYVAIVRMPVWIRWVHYLSFIKYGYDAVIINEFDGNTYAQIANFSSPYQGYDPIPGHLIVKNVDVIVESIGWNVLILFGWAVGFRVAAYLLLKYNYKAKR